MACDKAGSNIMTEATLFIYYDKSNIKGDMAFPTPESVDGRTHNIQEIFLSD